MIRSNFNYGLVLLAALGLMTACGTAQAADGTWNNTSGGTWSTPSNWSGGVIADGADSTADFSTLNITAPTTVTLDSERTIGHLAFGDTTVTSGWALKGSKLTMDTTTGTAPTITSNDWFATIHSVIASDKGLTKTGTGAVLWQMVDLNYQDVSGTITVAEGTLKLSRTGAYPARFFQSGVDVDFVVEDGATLDNYGARNTFTDVLYDPIPVTLKGGVLKVTSGDFTLNDLSMNTAASIVWNNNTAATTYVGNANWTVEASASGSSAYGSQAFTLVNGSGTAEFTIDVARGTKDKDFTIVSPLVDHATMSGSTVVKKGDGILFFNTSNSYVGDTRVEGGTFSTVGASLSDTADVHIDSGACLDLVFHGADTIDELFLNGAAVPVGTWGAIGSGADHTSSLITGTGLLNVLNSTWVPIPGDANGDNVVDDADAAALAANWLSTSATWSMGDFNDDQVVDATDATILAANWQVGSTAAVPEPGAIALLATGLIGLLASAWRKRK